VSGWVCWWPDGTCLPQEDKFQAKFLAQLPEDQEAGESRFVSAIAPDQMLINICRVGVRRMGPSSFQWCPVTGQGAMGTN